MVQQYPVVHWKYIYGKLRDESEPDYSQIEELRSKRDEHEQTFGEAAASRLADLNVKEMNKTE